MTGTRKKLNRYAPLFAPGGRFEKWAPLFEMIDTFLYTPDAVTVGRTHIRDAMDMKRLMITVAVALIPCILIGLYNTGFQAHLALAEMGIAQPEGWRAHIMRLLGLGFSPDSVVACFVHGALYFIPIYLVTNVVGGIWEVTFAIVRKHEINEGFLVTGMLFPLILPPTIPLWQVALGISFGVVIAKEVFGGVGRNFMNPALAARAFLFFAYPAAFSGGVYVAVDGYSGATALGIAATNGMDALSQSFSLGQAFIGTIPGVIGETSFAAILLGALILLYTGIGSWRIMLSMLVSAVAMALCFNILGVGGANPMLAMGPLWHIMLGGFAFGLVFMATDPVTAPWTDAGKWVYGALIGAMTILIRVLNPAYPESVMLAILFGNVTAPLMDYAVMKFRIRKRRLRYARN